MVYVVYCFWHQKKLPSKEVIVNSVRPSLDANISLKIGNLTVNNNKGTGSAFNSASNSINNKKNTLNLISNDRSSSNAQ